MGEKDIRNNPVGTVRLIDHNKTVLIPTTSLDPRDPLNLPQWHKWIITIIISLYMSSKVINLHERSNKPHSLCHQYSLNIQYRRYFYKCIRELWIQPSGQ